MKPHCLEPACQGVLDRGDGQHVGRASEHEPPRDTPPVDCQFQGGEESRDPLYFIQSDQVGKIGYEAHGVCQGPFPDHIIVKAEVSVGTAGSLRQCGLPALARALDEDDRRVFEGFVETPLYEPGIKLVVRHRPIVNFGPYN